MKTLLLATSALVAFAGVAAAEVTLDGDARLGLRYDSSLETDFFGERDSGWNVVSRARVRFTMTGETDTGLSFGARFRANEVSRASVGSNASNTDGEVWIEGAYGRLTVGDIDSALESAVGDLPEVGVSGLNYYNEFQYTTSDFDTESDFDNAGVIYQYQFGDASIYASFMDQFVGTGAEEIDGDSWALGAGYELGNYTFGIGYEHSTLYVDPVIYTTTAQTFGEFDIDGDDIPDVDSVFDNDNNTWGISGGTSWSGITFKAVYMTTNVDGTGLLGDPFDDYDIRQYGIGAEYDMANGIGVAAFWRRVDGDSVFGEDHEVDVWGLGAAYDLGGGAELKAGIAHLDGTSPFFGGGFDRTSADFGLRMNF